MAKFRIKDREYEWDGELTVEEAMLLFDKAGVGISELGREQLRGNPYVQATMMFIMKKRAGEAVRWQDMAAYKLTDMVAVPDEAADEDSSETAAVGERPDPTEDDGTTPETGIDAT